MAAIFARALKLQKRRDKIRTNRNHLCSWLKLNRLIDETHDNVLNQCMGKITTALGGTKALLKVISHAIKPDLLSTMHQTLISEKTKYQNNKTILEHNIDDSDDDEHMNANENIFLWLPNECISHICGYLPKKRIKSFKETSRQMAIVCLDEMNKISISTYNANNLFNNENFHLYHFRIKVRNIAQTNRHNPRKRYYSLFEEWSTQYDIPEQNLLIFSYSSPFRKVKLLNASSDMRLEHLKKRRYLICDNRHFVVINGKNVTQFDIEKHKYNTVKDYKLLILEYFDLMKQSVNIAQFILYSPLNGTQDQISVIDKYVSNLGNDKVWHSELKYTMDRMHDDKRKLRIFAHNDEYVMDLVTGTYGVPTQRKWNLFTFQLNSNSCLHTTNALSVAQTKCKERKMYFQSNASSFCENVMPVTATFPMTDDGTRLISSIETFYNTQLNVEEKQIYDVDTDLDRIMRILKKGAFSIVMNTSLFAIHFQQKIMRLFGNIIDSKYIEICTNKGKRIESVGQKPISEPTFQCYFVLYDATAVPMEYDKVYNITIFTPATLPTPFHDATEGVTIRIRYKSSCAVKELINYVFHLIFASDKHVLYPMYQHLLPFYYEMNNMGNDGPAVMDKASSFMMARQPCDGAKLTYLCNDVLPLRGVHSNIDLYIFQTPSNDALKNIKLTIKFAIEFAPRHEVGLPLEIWISEEDTLEDIIDTYFSKMSENIDCVYRVAKRSHNNSNSLKITQSCPYCNANIEGSALIYSQHLSNCLNKPLPILKDTNIKSKESEFGGELVRIEKTEYEEYKPFYEFIAGYSNDFLLMDISAFGGGELFHYTNDQRVIDQIQACKNRQSNWMN